VILFRHGRQAVRLPAGADAAGVVLGASVPIVVTSRADSERTRIASCAVAVLMARARRATTGSPA